MHCLAGRDHHAESPLQQYALPESGQRNASVQEQQPPFNAPLGNFQPKLWWQGLDPKLTIVHLAVFLYDVVPHAATVQRLFSLMGWYHNARRNRLGVDSTGSMTAIKTFYEQKPPWCASCMRHTHACNDCKVT